MMKIVNLDTAFDEASRRRILTAYFEAYDRWVESELDGKSDEEALAAVSRLWDEYLAGLPIVELSRNPFTGEVFRRSLDVFGLDGLWWRADNPARPIELLRPTEVAFTGAVAIQEPVERVPFVCKPGPGVPFVVPRVLNQQGVKAVLSAVPVGRHRGYAVVYFAEAELRTMEGFGDWGRTLAYYDLGDDDFGWHEWIPAPSDFDFDLVPWLQSGKLLWIAPDDDTLTPRTGPECPYVGLPGNRFYQVVSEGSVWEDVLYEPSFEVEEYEAGDEAFESPEPAVAAEPAVSEPPPAAPSAPPEIVAPPVVQSAAPKKASPEPPPVPKPRFCKQCGAPLKPSARFCPKCGTAVGS